MTAHHRTGSTSATGNSPRAKGDDPPAPTETQVGSRTTAAHRVALRHGSRSTTLGAASASSPACPPNAKLTTLCGGPSKQQGKQR